MSESDNIRIVEQFVMDVWNNQDLALAKEILSPDYRVTFYGLPQIGHTEYFYYVPKQLATWPDIHVTIEQILGDGDWVAVRFVWTATHSKPAFGFPPTGEKVTGRGIAMYKVEDGQIVEGWACEDVVSIMRTIGALPGPHPYFWGERDVTAS